MQIEVEKKEKVIRQCCQSDDLKPYNGALAEGSDPNSLVFFCEHCGQIVQNVNIETEGGEAKQMLLKLPLKITPPNFKQAEPEAKKPGSPKAPAPAKKTARKPVKKAAKK